MIYYNNIACLKNDFNLINALPQSIKNKDINECNKLATDAGSHFFGLQTNNNGNTCVFGGPKSLEMMKKNPTQSSNDCKKIKDNIYGIAPHATALYTTKTAAEKAATDKLAADIKAANINRILFNSLYVGCYKDNATQKTIPNYSGTTAITVCNDLAKKAGSPYFSMQNWEKNDIASCFVGNASLNLDQIKKYGESSDCIKSNDDYNHYGKTLANAVYKTRFDDSVSVGKATVVKAVPGGVVSVGKAIVNNVAVSKKSEITKVFLECTQSQNKIQCTLQM